MNRNFPEISTPAQRLAQAIAGSGINQNQLSKASGVANSTISDILSGKNARPSYDKMRALGAVLSVSTDWLFGHSTPSAPAAAEPSRARGRPPGAVSSVVREDPAEFRSGPPLTHSSGGSLWRTAVAALPPLDLLRGLSDIIHAIPDDAPLSADQLAEIRWALDTLTQKLTKPPRH